MGVTLLSISVVCTILSLAGLLHWTEKSLGKFRLEDLLSNNYVNSSNPTYAWELLFSSCTTLTLIASFSVNLFVSIILSLKKIFFSELYTSEIRKLLERLVNYIIYKGTFLPLVVPPTVFQAGLWSTWLVVLCFLKMFQALARDRLERLNACPSAAPWTYFRVYSALLLVFSLDLFWILLCLTIYRETSSKIYLLLFFEPCSIAFETLQAIVVHGFQLLEIWLHHSMSEFVKCRFSKVLDFTPAGSFGECKSVLVRDFGFFLDIMTMVMALAHYLHIWWLHGMAFHIIDAVLFLNIRTLLSGIMKRSKGFIKLRIALGTLHGALPDATSEELQLYNDECAICREPMAKAKKLSCKHLFHLACLRSWLDQSLSESYSCPTCRKPLIGSRSTERTNSEREDISRDEEVAREFDRQNLRADESQNTDTSDWRRGMDTRWLGLDGGGTSGLSRVMRQLAGVGEDTLFHTNEASTSTSTSGNSRGRILSMAETVREVLPHVDNEIILEDLQRTNSVVLTVNNLVQL